MVRLGVRLSVVVCAGGMALALSRTATFAVSLDKDGDIKLGVRTYVNARVGTEDTNKTVSSTTNSQTFPFSAAGHLRQNRFFLEAEFNHDLDRLIKEGMGPLTLLNDLPFRVKNVSYHLTFRGEGDGLYDWGPREYSTAVQYTTGPAGPGVNLPDNPVSLNSVNVGNARHHLRHFATDRERLYQASLDMEVGDLFLRLGRQIWAWGETDGFRLLDNINPIDSSFGGFLVPLDERRVPLDMLRAEYRLPDFWVVSEASLQSYGAIDDKVGFAPGIPQGSPWNLPNLSAPSSTTFTKEVTPKRTIRDIRGGGRFVWNMYDATFSVAHYYTYFDTPGLQVFVNPTFPVPSGVSIPGHNNCPSSSNATGGCYSALAKETAPLVQVDGGTTTFAVPSWYTVVRSEFAYFRNEPRFRQYDIDPFMFHFFNSNLTPKPPAGSGITGGRRTGDSINYVLGFDINRFIRQLNPNQTFFISTQIFYKHLLGVAPERKVKAAGVHGQFLNVEDQEVLPVPEKNVVAQANGFVSAFGPLEPKFVTNPTDQILQTLFIGTSYYSGQVNPGFTLFYDWTGALVYQPSITFSRDPFRFTMDYSIIDAHRYKGASGVSLLRDRDNVEFRFEYVI